MPQNKYEVKNLKKCSKGMLIHRAFPQGPLLRTSKCIEGWVGWGRKWGVGGVESNCLMYQYPKFIPLLFNKLMLMNLSEAICTGFVLISKSFAI